MNLRSLLIAALAGSIAPLAHADSVRVDLQMVTISVPEALRLVPQLRRAESFIAAAEHVQKLLTTGEATLESWLHAESEREQKLSSESLEEVRYPLEIDSGGCFLFGPSPFAQEILDDANGLTPRKRAERDRIRREQLLLVGASCGRPTPGAFEVRNTGATLECEASMGWQSNRLMLAIVAQRTTCDGFHNTTTGEPGPPSYIGATQPHFSTWRTQTLLPFPENGGALLGSFVLSQPHPRVLLFLLHAQHSPPKK